MGLLAQVLCFWDFPLYDLFSSSFSEAALTLWFVFLFCT